MKSIWPPTMNSIIRFLKINRENTAFCMAFVLVLLGLIACNKSTTLGSDFLGGDSLSFLKTSDFEVSNKTVVRDPLRTYFGSDNLPLINTFLCGELDDPYLGESKSEIFTELHFVARLDNPFMGNIIDSVSLVLRYDSFGVAGDSGQMVTLEVFEIIEELDASIDHDSEASFMTSATPVVSHSFVPAPYDSVYIQNDTGGMVKVSPRLRIPIDTAFLSTIRRLDSGYWSNTDSLKQMLNGINIRVNAQNTMLGFSLESAISGLFVYYHEPDPDTTISKTFQFNFSDRAVKTPKYTHDYSGTLAGDIMADSLSGMSDSISFLQEMQGLSPKLTVTGLSKLSGEAINHAELELTVYEPAMDDTLAFPKVFLLTAQENQGDTSIVNSIDTDNSLVFARSGFDFYKLSFKGDCREVEENGEKRKVYYAVITSQIQDAVLAGQDELIIYISSFLRQESPKRVLFYGENTDFPIKLHVTYTDI